MIQIGLVGKANSGKSTFFKAATLIDVKIASYPFTTIESNTGIAHIIVDCVCKEFGVKCDPKTGKCENGKRFVPVKLIDVGGLVPGAHLGKGIGNKFLDDLRQASTLIQIVDCSGLTDSEGKPTKGYDPSREIEFLAEEIDLWFAGIIKKALEKFKRKLPTSSRTDLVQMLTDQLSGLEVKKEHIEQALEKTFIEDIDQFAKTIREISKPILIAANKIDLKPAQENFEELKEKFKLLIPTSADAETALKKASQQELIDYLPGDGFEVKGKLDEKQSKALEFIKKEVIDKYSSTGVQDCLDKAVFELLDYIVVYPVANANKLTDKDGKILPDAFLVPKGTTVKELAFIVHTELGEKFICGIDARTKRKLSADYELKNNDVVEIAFSK
jgi:hypothetical protein